jgi:hypothetical protein
MAEPKPKRRRGHTEKVLSLAELDRLRRAEALGELEEVDPDTQEDLFLATMEEIAGESGHTNPWDTKEITNAKAVLEGSSRKGVLQQQQDARRAQRGLAPVDNTAGLHRIAQERQAKAAMASPDARVGASAAHTSVRFVGMSLDSIRMWLDKCRAAGCCAGTKASQIRLMASHGLGVTLMAKVLDTTYQQVYQTARYQAATDVDVSESAACQVCFRRKIVGGCSGRR